MEMNIRNVIDGVMEATYLKATTAEVKILACELLLKELQTTTPSELQNHLEEILFYKEGPRCTITLSFPLEIREPM
ncbi:hypothetical protein AAGS61_01770 [Lysinibacillus sp. KU-BSD001]|uniref:hypothetical protein n=1 Tax=Lysinibacillus sp. KU-BSD001 TaxID=3141328 RepID=UPI0036E35619